MSIWTQVNNEPITTNRSVAVENESGTLGWIDVSQRSPGLTRLVGPVYQSTIEYDSEGTPVSESRTILDHDPTID